MAMDKETENAIIGDCVTVEVIEVSQGYEVTPVFIIFITLPHVDVSMDVACYEP